MLELLRILGVALNADCRLGGRRIELAELCALEGGGTLLSVKGVPSAMFTRLLRLAGGDESCWRASAVAKIDVGRKTLVVVTISSPRTDDPCDKADTGGAIVFAAALLARIGG